MIRLRLRHAETVVAIVLLGVIGRASVAAADDPSQRSADRPHGDVAAISDWALAGVVWGDASFSKRMAVAAVGQTTDEQRLAKLNSTIQRLDRIITAMEQFGWRQLERPANATTRPAGTAGSRARTGDREAANAYDESVKIAEAIDRGVENGPTGPAAAAAIKQFSGLAEDARRTREANLPNLPYATDSLYERYLPASRGDGSIRTLDPSNAVNAIVDNEVDRLRASFNATLDSLSGQPLPSTNLSHYTTMGDSMQADATWVQMQLDTNQIRWNMIGKAKISDGMLADAINQLNARMRLASRITKNEQLEAALRQ